MVIKLGRGNESNELFAVVGSPDPQSRASGAQINMALVPRPVGSAAKPFIYAKAFERGARPYTLVDDREYRYMIGTGFAFYPKNYDGKYRGEVTLHYALANSLNVPAVKTLEFAGLERVNEFLLNMLGFRPRQPLDTYGLGIALGGLEVDPLTFAQYMTIFPNDGVLAPLKIGLSGDAPVYLTPPMSKPRAEIERVIAAPFVRLVTKILSDRSISVDQFGMKGNLNLTKTEYAVKTGTTYDYHDSWTVGYTPDFLVAVWIGNSDNTPIRQVSGQQGAGRVWRDAMELFLHLATLHVPNSISRKSKNTNATITLNTVFRETTMTMYGVSFSRRTRGSSLNRTMATNFSSSGSTSLPQNRRQRSPSAHERKCDGMSNVRTSQIRRTCDVRRVVNLSAPARNSLGGPPRQTRTPLKQRRIMRCGSACASL